MAADTTQIKTIMTIASENFFTRLLLVGNWMDTYLSMLMAISVNMLDATATPTKHKITNVSKVSFHGVFWNKKSTKMQQVYMEWI